MERAIPFGFFLAKCYGSRFSRLRNGLSFMLWRMLLMVVLGAVYYFGFGRACLSLTSSSYSMSWIKRMNVSISPSPIKSSWGNLVQLSFFCSLHHYQLNCSQCQSILPRWRSHTLFSSISKKWVNRFTDLT